MQFSQIGTVLGYILSLSFVGVLIGDWVRLRIASHAEERKHIARAITDLLQLRFLLMGLCELPKHFKGMFPNEIREHIPDDAWRSIDLTQFIPVDEEMPNRYRKAVEEISGFRPVLAYRLLGKERYFDLRTMLTKHFSGSPGSPLIASRITEALDREAIPALEETLRLLAKSHGFWMRLSVNRALRHRQFEEDLIPPALKNTFQEQISQLIATGTVPPIAPCLQNNLSQPGFIPIEQEKHPPSR